LIRRSAFFTGARAGLALAAVRTAVPSLLALHGTKRNIRAAAMIPISFPDGRNSEDHRVHKAAAFMVPRLGFN
jgi:hypothetical protein